MPGKISDNQQPSLPISLTVLHFFYFSLGFTATALQIVFLRAFLSLFYGNELSIGIFMFSWMLWTAIGSFVFSKIKKPGSYIHTHLFLFGLIIPFTLILIQFLRVQSQPIIGSLPDLFTTLVTAILSLVLFGIFSGGLFPLYSSIFKKVGKLRSGEAGSVVYLWETIGSAVSGLLAGLFLIRFFKPVTLTLIFAYFNILAALYFLLKFNRPKKGLISLLYFIIAFFSFTSFLSTESKLFHKLWDGLQIIDQRSSFYGELVLTKLGDTHTLYQNGVPLFTIPDPQTAEETVHYSLLLHDNPKKILLIGGGFSGAVFEALKHPSVKSVDYVELDPEIINIYRQYFPQNWDRIEKDPRIHIHLSDGRHYLQKTKNKYDVIIIALPDPYTVQLNRFYTEEFFKLCSRRLNPQGILSFQITSSENYINDALARYIRCIYNSFKSVFRQNAFLPGSKLQFFLSNRKAPLELNTSLIMERLKNRNIQTLYVQEYYLAFKLLEDRLLQVQTVLTGSSFNKINSDFKPMAYFFDIILWTSKTSSRLGKQFEALMNLPFGKTTGILLVAFIAFMTLTFGKKDVKELNRLFTPVSMFVVGFSVMSLELIILIGFQVIYGYIYQQIALFIALFMAGMAWGSWLGIKWAKRLEQDNAIKTVLAVHVAFFFLSLLIIPLFKVLYLFFNVSQIIFFVLAMISGFFGGIEFPLISKVYFGHSEKSENKIGFLYGWDLIGSLVGSLLSSIILIPVFGLQKCGYFIAALNLTIVFYYYFIRALRTQKR
ncbi:MAG: hypothetical protein GXO77_03375 [Calditrichaeota bacterium]|nr:hypothetical protein [Calditrichota bacterium]